MSVQNIIIEKLVLGGDCIGNVGGKTVFIPFAIPGETVKIEIVESKRDYDVAKIVDIVESSPFRVMPPCKFYTKCGGCNMMHIDYAYQRQLRSQCLKECFEREKINTPEITSIFSTDTGYRCRMQLHDGGFLEKKSNNCIKLDKCIVATDEINEYLKKTPQEKRGNGRVHIFGDSSVISQNSHLEQSDSKLCKVVLAQEDKKEKKQNTVIKSGRRKIKKVVNPYFSGTVLNPENTITVEIASKKISFDAQGFFQSNIKVLEKSIDLVCDGLSGKNVLDMYSGAGTFSVFLADKFEKVTMVEHNRDALVFAEINMNGKNHSSYGFSGTKWVKENADTVIKQDGVFDAVVIDPPRSGMEKEVCQWLCKTHPLHIRSVSCDPATHARDAAFLVQAGYKLSKLFLLDFYPQTSHIESLAYFDYVGD